MEIPLPSCFRCTCTLQVHLSFLFCPPFVLMDIPVLSLWAGAHVLCCCWPHDRTGSGVVSLSLILFTGPFQPQAESLAEETLLWGDRNTKDGLWHINILAALYDLCPNLVCKSKVMGRCRRYPVPVAFPHRNLWLSYPCPSLMEHFARSLLISFCRCSGQSEQYKVQCFATEVTGRERKYFSRGENCLNLRFLCFCNMNFS